MTEPDDEGRVLDMLAYRLRPYFGKLSAALAGHVRHAMANRYIDCPRCKKHTMSIDMEKCRVCGLTGEQMRLMR